VKGRRGLVALDLATRTPRVIAAPGDSDVLSFHWVNDSRLIFDVYDLQVPLGMQEGGGLFAINLDGSDLRTLAPTLRSQARAGNFVYRYTRLVGPLNDGSSDVIVASNERNSRYEDLYRMDTVSGRKTLLTDSWPGDPVHWVADTRGVARAVVTTDRGVRYTSWWRPSADARWQAIHEFGLRDASVVPIAFDADGSLIVASDVGRATAALHRYDTAKMAVGEVLAAHPHADIDQVVRDRRDNRIVGARYDDGKPGVAWFDEGWARTAAMIDRALPQSFNAISRGVADRVLVDAVSDVDPGSLYLLDLGSRKLEYLLSARPELKPAEMPRREAVRYKARDGLMIPAMLTLPRHREARGLPLVLYVHGGPYVRGTVHWAWRDEPAFLAALGYAVLEPDFRGSLGWGRAFFQAGWKQWGLAMQDDLVDGVDWLAARGTIDPKRVCIMGASYGGYAVMMGLARDPERFRCGINYVGVTDINLMFDVAWSDMSDSDFLKYAARDIIADPERDAAQLKATSPLANAKKIRAPVLMAYGVEDYRVPIIHGERMRDALTANGTPVEWVAYSGEGHGFLLEENRFDFYRRVAAFLAKHLPANESR
jgi:dipeptidyl aminopeptidase/acylaminoacyl peptidase